MTAIEIPDNEDAACDLDKIESYCAIRGLYDHAEKVSGAARRLRASEEDWHRVADLRAIEIDRLRAENARLTEECEALGMDVVWAVKHRAHTLDFYGRLSYTAEEGREQINVVCSESNADILRAVREARNGVA